MVTHLSCSLSFFCGFPKLIGFEMSFKALNPSFPLCFSTDVSGCFIMSMMPWRICSAFRSMLQSIFCIICVFQQMRPAGFFPCSVGGSFLSLFAALVFTPTASCPRSSLIFLLSPSFSFHAYFPHARTLCQLWYNIRTCISLTFVPPPPLQWRNIC